MIRTNRNKISEVSHDERLEISTLNIGLSAHKINPVVCKDVLKGRWHWESMLEAGIQYNISFEKQL